MATFSTRQDAVAVPGLAANTARHSESEAAVRMLDFAGHKEASFYSTCLAGCLLVGRSIERCVAWLSFVEGGDSSAYESDQEYLLATELVRWAISGLVRCIRYYKTTSVPPTRSGDVTDFTMISCASVLYVALASQFCTEPQRRCFGRTGEYWRRGRHWAGFSAVEGK